MNFVLSAMKTLGKGQSGFRLFLIGLCLLIILAPRLAEPAPGQPSELSISATTPDYTFLANTQKSDGDQYRSRNNNSNTYRLPLAAATDSLCASLVAPTPGVASVRINQFDDIPQRNLHQAYRFLDLPPPSA